MEVNEVDREAFERAGEEIYHEFAESVSGGEELTSQAIALRGGEG